MTEKAREIRESEVTGWSVNRDRTLITFKKSGDSPHVSCWRLDPSGQVAEETPTWMLMDEQPGSWDILGWANTSQLALWRRLDDRSELQIVDVTDRGSESVLHKVVGRPVECRVTQSGRTEVLVAVSNGDRALLCLHYPDLDSYLLFEGAGEFSGAGAWDAEGRVLVVNVDAKNDSPGVQLYDYDARGYTEIKMFWPHEVLPVRAAGYSCGVVGLTGVNCSGQPVPGMLEMSSRAVRWFDAHAGYSCVEVAPSDAYILAAAWNGKEFTYRVLDITGNQIDDLHSDSGIATDLCFSGDGQHLVGWYQSPAMPPDVICWDVKSGEMRPVSRRNGRAVPGDMRWALRWAPDAGGQKLPEWMFEPGRGSNGGTVLFLHGGPRSRLNQTYDPVIAALVGAGWTVVGMNYPGSSGYGAEYRERIRSDWGGADATSIEWRVRSLHAEAGYRPICLYGHSYGGYLALLVASTVPELLQAVAVWAPVTDIQRLLGASAGMQRRWLEEELGDLRLDVKELWERSPVSRVLTLCSTRLLVGHGQRDEQCPVEQSRRLVRLLSDQSRADGFVQYLEDADSSHTPLQWRRWTDAVVAHFGRVTSSLLLAGGRLDKPS